MNRKNKQDMKIKTFLLFTITLLIWLLLFFVKLHFWGADGKNVIDDIVSNMIGIIPPLLIFDFGLEYITRDNIAVDISFSMPQKRGVNDFMVSISEPTYAPDIELSYPDNEMEVKAFSFLNDCEDSSLEKATHNMDSFEFNLQNRWIYPMSGVVFAINTTREE